ncbi:DNA polymerase III subunit beta [Paenibacillus xanthanilyticus]|uniref:Beta sliding clamp n=1 Tax=Paenibacillus xanthanilyticus TaxID=1783531 RepID=A0ABV8K912_9BACL
MQKASLVQALQQVSKAVSVSSPIPVLAGIYVEVTKDEVVFMGSDASLTIKVTLNEAAHGLRIHRTGRIVVPARYLNEIVRKLSADVITFDMDEPLMLRITAADSQARLCGMDPEEFPSMDDIEPRPLIKFRIHTGLLKASIAQVAASAAISDMRPVLTGVSFDYSHQSLKLMASDGIRLASSTIFTGTNSGPAAQIVIPARNLGELSKLLKHDHDETEIEIRHNRVRFTAHELQVESALIDGAFPSLSHVIPDAYASELLVERTRLLRAAECVSVLAGDRIIKLDATEGSLALSSRTAEIGEVHDRVPLRKMKGKAFRISVNGKFLMDMLRGMDGEFVRLRFVGRTSPLVLLPEDETSPTLFLITPIRTNDG